MKWYEFKMDCGDGSFRSCRFQTREEAESALERLENELGWFLTDGEGVCEVDTDALWFWFDVEEFLETEEDDE